MMNLQDSGVRANSSKAMAFRLYARARISVAFASASPRVSSTGRYAPDESCSIDDLDQFMLCDGVTGFASGDVVETGLRAAFNS